MTDLENEVNRLVDSCENISYFLDGKIHRDNDLPAVIYEDRSKLWLRNGILHREGDLPSFIYDGYIFYYKYDKLHRDVRVNGKLLPAVIHMDGIKEYYLDGVEVDEDGNRL
jgi:hypothetical protein